jgi:hypothetical protein
MAKPTLSVADSTFCDRLASLINERDIALTMPLKFWKREPVTLCKREAHNPLAD